MAVESPPIIIKKIKKGGHGHHGGAWKVAFADFVTAMMAFFMLMWLLGSTTPEQKSAIADYMNDPTASSGPGGSGKSPVFDGGSGINDGKGPSPMPQNAPGQEDQPSAASDPMSEYQPPSFDEAEKILSQSRLQHVVQTTPGNSDVLECCACRSVIPPEQTHCPSCGWSYEDGGEGP
jgi:chemotaxis protein MotB